MSSGDAGSDPGPGQGPGAAPQEEVVVAVAEAPAPGAAVVAIVISHPGEEVPEPKGVAPASPGAELELRCKINVHKVKR